MSPNTIKIKSSLFLLNDIYLSVVTVNVSATGKKHYITPTQRYIVAYTTNWEALIHIMPDIWANGTL